MSTNSTDTNTENKIESTRREENPEIFFAGDYEGNYEIVRHWFGNHLKENEDDYLIDESSLRIGRLDRETRRDITAAIDESINRSCVVLVDITPAGIFDGEPVWNPNVMYELGRADQVKAPVFRFCQKKFERFLPPFDIRTSRIYWYDPTPRGLDSLCKEFRDWYRERREKGVASFYNASKFLSAARKIRDRILRWPGDKYPQFHVVLNEFMGVVERNVLEMTSFIETKGKTYRLEPSDPKKVIDILFSETLKTMGRRSDGDSYWTYSCVPFLQNLGEQSRFLTELTGATGREVDARRLILLNGDHDRDGTDQRIIDKHQEIADDTTGYEIRFLLCEKKPHEDDRHSGICRWKRRGGDEIVALKPRYEERSRNEIVLSGIEYEGDARSLFNSFSREWRGAAKTARECLEGKR